MWIKSDDRKTQMTFFLWITNISATIFMCFKRKKDLTYMDNTLPWVTYNNLRVNKTSWGNRNYWPQKRSRYITRSG